MKNHSQRYNVQLNSTELRGAESVYPTVLLLIRTRDHKSDKIDPLKRHIVNTGYQKREESGFKLFYNCALQS